MNYYDARQIINDDGSLGGFHYTQQRDKVIWPVGYCRDHPPHPTRQDASRCYRRWLLDTRLRVDGRYAREQRHCEECSAWTDRYAEIIDWFLITLCDLHCTRETVERHLGEIGGVISSF